MLKKIKVKVLFVSEYSCFLYDNSIYFCLKEYLQGFLSKSFSDFKNKCMKIDLIKKASKHI